MEESAEAQELLTNAQKEKSFVALSSVFAAVFLTGSKLVIGLLTGSLGILSEAAHSGLDSVAALVTYFAVRSSDKPADREHHYGHEKIENFSALIETELLLVTCIWIIYEAIHRLFFHEVEVEVNAWAFGVVIVSIMVDVSRSTALMRVAKKYHSQALEADALHFRTDVWSSSVVLCGLLVVLLGEYTSYGHWLQKADPLAALGVAALVISVCYRLGKRSIDALLDSAPKGLYELVDSAVKQINGVRNCRHLRLRQGGKRTFVDLSIEVDPNLSIPAGEAISRLVEEAIKKTLPYADVVIQTGSYSSSSRSIYDKIRSLAEAAGAEIHNIFVFQAEKKLFAESHLEISENLTILRAHEETVKLETSIKKLIPELERIDIHIEPRKEATAELRSLPLDVSEYENRIRSLILSIPAIEDCHNITIRSGQYGLYCSAHVIFEDKMLMHEVHDQLEAAELLLTEEISDLERVLLHPEPKSQANH